MTKKSVRVFLKNFNKDGENFLSVEERKIKKSET